MSKILKLVRWDLDYIKGMLKWAKKKYNFTFYGIRIWTTGFYIGVIDARRKEAT